MGAITTTLNRMAVFGFVESRGLNKRPGASRRPLSPIERARSYRWFFAVIRRCWESGKPSML